MLAFANKEPEDLSLVFALSSWNLGFSFFYIFNILANSGCVGFLEGRISFSIIFLYFSVPLVNQIYIFFVVIVII